MPAQLILSNGRPLLFEPGLPEDYKGAVLPGATPFFSKTNAGEIIFQELKGELYSIRLSLARFYKNIFANGLVRNAGLYSNFMLKKGMRKEVDTIGKLHIREGQYSCFFTVPTSCSAKFQRNSECSGIDIFYSPKLLEELLPFFPELRTVLASGSTLLPAKTSWMLPSMKQITNELLNCPYDEATRIFYFDLKVRELLYQLLENTYKQKSTPKNFTPWEIARIHKARDILHEHISKRPPSVRTLSKEVALNEYKLKTGFRQYFNSGIFEWLIEQRMQYAKQLILTTDKPIKDICSMVGYPRTTNFITAFRRRFGMTPGSLRR